jgi:CubicO group peptidase (beta-lactamase class C family)
MCHAADTGRARVSGQGERCRANRFSRRCIRHRHSSRRPPLFDGNSLVDQAYKEANLFDREQTLAEMVTKLSKLPLAHQPGTTFEYSMSTDVLGRLVEIASRMDFDRFIEERITKPLGLSATGFHLREEDVARIAEPQVDPATGKRPPFYRDAATLAKKPKWMSGGGGMMSTAPDYWRFCQMLLNGGELDGVRLLSPSTVALMTSDALSPAIVVDVSAAPTTVLDLLPTPAMGNSFGLGFAVRKDAGVNPLPGSVGEFFWQGAFGTVFWVDPQQKLVATMMLQTPFNQFDQYRHELRYLVYQALTGQAQPQYVGSTAK